MAKSLLYYNHKIVSLEGDGVTLDDIRAAREALSSTGIANLYLRATDAFAGVEGGEGDVERVFIIGDDAEDEFCAAVRQAYEAVGVEVVAHELHQPEAPVSNPSAPEQSTLTELKARATELGLNFASNIGEAALRARVEAAEKSKEGDA